MADITMPRMFEYFWIQRAGDGAYALDLNGPEDRPLNVIVLEGEVVVSWRYDTEEADIDPDTARWTATRLMEAAVLADCQRVNLLVVGDVDPLDDLPDTDAVLAIEARMEHDEPIIPDDNIIEGDPSSESSHVWDEDHQQWVPRR